MSKVESILRYIAIFIIAAAVMISLFLLVALIPRERIQANMEESAEYLQQKGAAFPNTVLGLNCSKADYYADAVLLDIAYYLDPDHPAESISWANYYSEDAFDWNGMVTEYFPAAVEKQPEPNQQYLRYWHGSLTIVRLLLMWFNINGIYKLLGIVLWILLGSIITLLYRRGFGKEAVAFILSMIAVSIWFVPVCLEYIWMFLLMTVTSLIVILLLFAFGETFGNIFACVLGVLLVSEAFLLIRRSDIKLLIRDETLVEKKELEFYSWMKAEFEDVRNDFITRGTTKFVSEDVRQLIWKEKKGTGWLSTKVKEFESKCEEARQSIDELKSIIRLVIF